MSMLAHNEERWSRIPTLALWMILDKLCIIRHRVYFASVCKNWEFAAQSYRMMPQPCPWLMHRPNLPCTNWDLFNIFTKERINLHVPEFDLLETDFLCSKRGWLLFIDHGVITVKERARCHTRRHAAPCFILVNPSTDAKLKLPSLELKSYEGVENASVSLSEYDYPEHVVLNTYDALYIASMEDKKWTKYPFESKEGDEFSVISNLVVYGSKVYCLTYRAELAIFHMENLSWTKVYSNVDNHIDSYWRILESEGKIVMVGQARKLKPFIFFKLNDTSTCWEEMYQNDNENSFLLYGNHNFSVKENEGIKRVYQLNNCQDKHACNRKVAHIDICNIASGSRELYEPREQDGVDPPSHKGAVWVDLGWMGNLPPSCVMTPPKLKPL
ncbi:hypothetical protein ACHQM5_018570 [Ranunculus cassubicifolius]